jgi:hypothetical protein
VTVAVEPETMTCHVAEANGGDCELHVVVSVASPPQSMAAVTRCEYVSDSVKLPDVGAEQGVVLLFEHASTDASPSVATATEQARRRSGMCGGSP